MCSECLKLTLYLALLARLSDRDKLNSKSFREMLSQRKVEKILV